MSRPLARYDLATEPDFRLGPLDVRPSVCRIYRGEAEVRIEALTMSALVLLAKAGGATVPRDDLVNACWQGRFVSDEAIARTISKVRAAAREFDPLPFVLETVPKVGYRLLPADEAGLVDGKAPSASADEATPVPAARAWDWRQVSLVAGLVAVAFAAGVTIRSWSTAATAASVPAEVARPGLIHASDIQDAIMSLSTERLSLYLQQGWKLSWPIDPEGSTPLEWLPMVCQRAQHHDQARLVDMARMLVAAGANPSYQNKWGDTAYVISREGRYCGPKHPLTVYLRSITPGAAADPEEKQLGIRTP